MFRSPRLLLSALLVAVALPVASAHGEAWTASPVPGTIALAPNDTAWYLDAEADGLATVTVPVGGGPLRSTPPPFDATAASTVYGLAASNSTLALTRAVAGGASELYAGVTDKPLFVAGCGGVQPGEAACAPPCDPVYGPVAVDGDTVAVQTTGCAPNVVVRTPGQAPATLAGAGALQGLSGARVLTLPEPATATTWGTLTLRDWTTGSTLLSVTAPLLFGGALTPAGEVVYVAATPDRSETHLWVAAAGKPTRDLGVVEPSRVLGVAAGRVLLSAQRDQARLVSLTDGSSTPIRLAAGHEDPVLSSGRIAYAAKPCLEQLVVVQGLDETADPRLFDSCPAAWSHPGLRVAGAKLAIPLGCHQHAYLGCPGRVLVSVRSGRRWVPVAQAAYAIHQGQTATVRTSLSKPARALLARTRPKRLRVTTIARVPQGMAAGTKAFTHRDSQPVLWR